MLHQTIGLIYYGTTLLQLQDASLSFCVSLPPFPFKSASLLFFPPSLQLHHSAPLFSKSYTHRGVFLIHLLCNPVFISSPHKPSGKLLLLCSESDNLLLQFKSILLIFALFVPLETQVPASTQRLIMMSVCGTKDENLKQFSVVFFNTSNLYFLKCVV